MISIRSIRAVCDLVLIFPRWSDRRVAQEAGVCRKTVGRYRRRLRRAGLTVGQLRGIGAAELVSALGLGRSARPRAFCVPSDLSEVGPAAQTVAITLTVTVCPAGHRPRHRWAAGRRAATWVHASCAGKGGRP